MLVECDANIVVVVAFVFSDIHRNLDFTLCDLVSPSVLSPDSGPETVGNIQNIETAESVEME